MPSIWKSLRINYNLTLESLGSDLSNKTSSWSIGLQPRNKTLHLWQFGIWQKEDASKCMRKFLLTRTKKRKIEEMMWILIMKHSWNKFLIWLHFRKCKVLLQYLLKELQKNAPTRSLMHQSLSLLSRWPVGYRMRWRFNPMLIFTISCTSMGQAKDSDWFRWSMQGAQTSMGSMWTSNKKICNLICRRILTRSPWKA